MESRILNVKLPDDSWAIKQFAFSKQLEQGESKTLIFRLGLVISNFFRSMIGLSKFVVVNALEGEDIHRGRGGLERSYLVLESEVNKPTAQKTNRIVARRLGTAGMNISPKRHESGAVRVKERLDSGQLAFEANLKKASDRAREGLGDRNFVLAPFGGEDAFIEACEKFAQTDPSDPLFPALLKVVQTNAIKGGEQGARAALLKKLQLLWNYRESRP